MTKIKKNKYFLLKVLVSSISLVIIYISCYHFLITRDIKVSHSYKQFLLQHTKGKRLIIDSGSNSLFGINSKMLEKELGFLTINLADNAGYPLKNKLLRIEKYSHKGDIILLPLEWQYYTYKKIPDVFLNNLMGNLSFYYFKDSFNEELKLIQKTPIYKFLDNLKYHQSLIENEGLNLKNHIKKFKNGERGDYVDDGGVLELDAGTKSVKCDQYVLGSALENGFILTDKFKKNNKIIKRLKKKNIQVFFTWPVVAGDSCYYKSNSNNLNKLITQIRGYMKKNELLIIGSPYENRFPKESMLNTYYHLNKNARDRYTKMLILNIKQSKAYLWFKNNDENKKK